MTEEEKSDSSIPLRFTRNDKKGKGHFDRSPQGEVEKSLSPAGQLSLTGNRINTGIQS
ncbi:MAG: hypothetical protein ABIK38_01430 [candidate division WOR-3 bacterium]